MAYAFAPVQRYLYDKSTVDGLTCPKIVSSSDILYLHVQMCMHIVSLILSVSSP